jgi:hypothetical protein
MTELTADRDLSRGLEEVGRVKGERKFGLDRLGLRKLRRISR